MHPSQVLVTGATGYVGGRLVPELLDAGHEVRCLVRSPDKLDAAPWRDRVELVEGAIGDPALGRAMEGIDAAFFLVHSMGGDDDFAERDRTLARTFARAAATAEVGRIVYLGGLGREDDDLSAHLASRHEVGRVLAKGPTPVTELRAAVIVGAGSASFEMLRHLVENLPAMLTPRWVDTRVQPIAVTDVLHALVESVVRGDVVGRIVEIGGPDVLTYREMMDAYADVAGLRRRIVVPVPVLSPRLSSHWVGLVTPLPGGLASPLVESLVNEVVVTEPTVDLFGDREPLDFRSAVAAAIRSVRGYAVSRPASTGAVPRERSDTAPDAAPWDPDWAGGSVLCEEDVRRTGASPQAVFEVLASVGGEAGWHGGDAIFRARGMLDRLVGGPGARIGRDRTEGAEPGDRVDSWEVTAVDEHRLLRLRSDMRLPGDAFLEWTIDPAGGATIVRQRSIFVPRGLGGLAYWYASLPLHRVAFRHLLRALLAEVERRSTPDPGSSVPSGR